MAGSFLDVTRREMLFAGIAALLRADGAYRSRLTMEAYIFQQYAQREHKKLSDVLPEVFSMVQSAGFHNLELNAEFLAAEVRDQTLQLVRRHDLRMPSVYSGGPLHDGRAEKTIEQALTVGRACQPFGCVAVVCNADPKGEAVQKTDSELSFQAEALNRMGRRLKDRNLQLRVHNHTPEMLDGAREWRSNLQRTDPQYVSLCLDLDWMHQGDQNPVTLLKEAGQRVSEIHVRSSKDKLWLEAFEPGDIDYREIAAVLHALSVKPLIAVELAYRDNTPITRALAEDLKASRMYAEKVFELR